jgi:hypothetical protein
MIHTYPSHQDELVCQKWRQAKWSTIEQDDLIALTLRDGTVAVGAMDDHTSDRSVFWLRLSRAGGRRCYLSTDVTGVWTPPL